MRIGFRKNLRLLNLGYQLMKFKLVKFLYGFEFANQLVQRFDKQTLLCVLQKNGATIGANCDIETGLIFHNCNDYSNLIIQENSHVGKNCFFDLRDKINIGKNVTISMNCTLITHQDMGKSLLTKLFEKTKSSITIADDVYIGTNSTILKGVTIEKQSVVAAGSVVRESVDSGVIVGGVPAKIIRKIDT